MIRTILIAIVFVTCLRFCMYLSDEIETLKEKLRKSNEAIDEHRRLLDKVSNIINHRELRGDRPLRQLLSLY